MTKCGNWSFPLGKTEKIDEHCGFGESRATQGKPTIKTRSLRARRKLDNLGLIRYIGLVADLVADRCIDSGWSTDQLSDDPEHFFDTLVSGLIS